MVFATPSTSILTQLRTQSTIYRRHEARLARSYQLRDGEPMSMWQILTSRFFSSSPSSSTNRIGTSSSSLASHLDTISRKNDQTTMLWAEDESSTTKVDFYKTSTL
eukprot:CAMPEP_0176002386 /NCGR_PEP_ID=MMETSP0120_2-20121206/619_1 /TAXON_ID=160619 /ORGANISM="Kryptoperidinium foliaceum, Strain CCMP 1326" /LENGTH=105 /DNA_ID=CAMNT_0017334971 /DNA_START=63 /DNA_END=380 /DNA_ORIENTATION=-